MCDCVLRSLLLCFVLHLLILLISVLRFASDVHTLKSFSKAVLDRSKAVTCMRVKLDAHPPANIFLGILERDSYICNYVCVCVN